MFFFFFFLGGGAGLGVLLLASEGFRVQRLGQKARRVFAFAGLGVGVLGF